jgi:hypothetical protein
VIYSPPFDDGISFAWDVWACAVVLYAMLTNKLPFSKIELLSKRNLTLDLPLDFSDGMKNFFFPHNLLLFDILILFPPPPLWN